MLHIGGIVCYVHFFLVLYVLFTSLHTLVKMIEKASSGAVFSQIKPRSVTSSMRHAVCVPHSTGRSSQMVLVLNSWLNSHLDFCVRSLSVRLTGREGQLEQGRMAPCLVTCSEYLYALLTASWSWAYLTFPPAAAEDRALLREPINDAPAQLTEGCGIAQFSWRLPVHCGHFYITFSTLGMEEQYQKGYIPPFSKEERLSVTSSLFYSKKMQSTS